MGTITARSFYFRGKCSKMFLKVDWFMTRLCCRSSMRFANSWLVAAGLSQHSQREWLSLVRCLLLESVDKILSTLIQTKPFCQYVHSVTQYVWVCVVPATGRSFFIVSHLRRASWPLFKGSRSIRWPLSNYSPLDDLWYKTTMTYGMTKPDSMSSVDNRYDFPVLTDTP